MSASKDPQAVAVAELDVPAAEPDSGGRGWRRNGDKVGGFQYSNARGEPIRGKSHLARIERLAIPPAWTDVRISTTAGADLQATGYDAAGRKQYVYHPDFVARQAERKFKRMRRFFDALPTMRETTSRHLGAETRPVELRVMATLVRLINECYFRSARKSTSAAPDVRSDNAAEVARPNGRRYIELQLQRQKGVDSATSSRTSDLLTIVRQLMDLPGKRVFQYYDEHDELRAANGHDLNAYIRATMGKGLSAKDFRTWAGTLLAAQSCRSSARRRRKRKRGATLSKRSSRSLNNWATHRRSRARRTSTRCCSRSTCRARLSKGTPDAPSAASRHNGSTTYPRSSHWSAYSVERR
ncbi:MAG: hypothetical protein WKH64_10235 [Chloroflexia bacterium]